MISSSVDAISQQMNGTKIADVNRFIYLVQVEMDNFKTNLI